MKYLNVKGWLDEVTLSDTLEVAATLARLEAEQSGAYRELLLSYLDAQDWASLTAFAPDYTADANVIDLLHARQCAGFFKKLEPLGQLLGADREAKAYEKFLVSERLCADTNAVFSSLSSGHLCLIDDTFQLLELARWKIEKMLGPCPSLRELKPVFGPGASTTVRKRKAIPAEKLHGRLACSVATVSSLPLIFGEFPHLFNNHSRRVEFRPLEDCDGFEVTESVDVEVSGGKLQFVPKDANSYRAIVVEPSLTGFIQLGIGDFMARRLRLNGVDITDQTTNQKLARFGSVRGSLGTLDLSSASDTVSTMLVKYLLPWDWFQLLSDFRTPSVTYRKQEITLEKFSSMGNGFTFPLETLIFYALVWAASEHHERAWINAYGDDLVCGAESAERVIALLTFCGFVINKEKSYVDGPFRESCGADFFKGIDIRPYHLKRFVSCEVLFTMHNFYRRQHDEMLANAVLSFIPPYLRIWGPDGYGDGHLICENPRLRLHQRDLGWGGYVFDTFARKAARSTRVHPGDYLQLLYSVYASEGGSQESGDGTVWWTMNRLLYWAFAGESCVLKADSGGKVIKTYPSAGKQYKRTSIYTLSRG